MENLFKNNHLSEFWGEHSSPAISFFALTPYQAGDCPKVVVIASWQGMSVCLSYYIEPCEWLDFDELSTDGITRQDFLWEWSCLECFFELNGLDRYLELNIAPNGAFNAYRFESYRTPNTMPPVRDENLLIYQTDNNRLAGWHTRHITVCFDEYFADFAKQGRVCQLTKINPTVILYQNGKSYFYAVKHANPPDFHDKTGWVDL